mmetsp:Transcript_64138/g.171729  ORF Transcript_64138/g.171729 Transcript_64138/m.171729 type:complete len:116 (+) Transcript_64138:2-349(+)
MEELRLAQEKADRQRRRDERRAFKDLHRPRRCKFCGQSFSHATNRPGNCVHGGKWANWGTNAEGKKVEWLFEWTCCRRKEHNGPANGLSTCPRSDPHEEDERDLREDTAGRDLGV